VRSSGVIGLISDTLIFIRDRFCAGYYVLSLIRVLAVLVSLATALLGQGKMLKARQFLVDGYGSVMTIDMKKVRDRGVWDELYGSPVLRALLRTIYTFQAGVSIDAIDQVTMVPHVPIDAGPEDRGYVIITIEGNSGLDEDFSAYQGRYTETKVAGYTVLHDEWVKGEAIAKVSPKLLVFGPTAMLVRVLEGEPRSGLPSGDVLSFTAGKPNLLGYFVGDIQKDSANRQLLTELLPEVSWPDGDAPTFFCIRLMVFGDEDDPHLQLEVILRHGKNGEGIVVSERVVAAALDRLMKVTEMRLFLPLLKKIKYERDRTDAIWRLDLGRARGFGGTLGVALPALMVYAGLQEAEAVGGVGNVQVEEVEGVNDVAQPIPVKPIKPKPKEKPKPKQARKPVTTGGGGDCLL